MIKRTRVHKVAEKVTVVQMTSAVKSKSGFAPIAQLTFMDLTNSKHDIDEKTDGQLVRLMPFDPRRHTLSLGLYVGAKESKFDLGGLEKNLFGIHRFQTENFQLIVLATFLQIPALPVGRITEYETKAGELYAEGPRIIGRSEGISPKNCAREFLILGNSHKADLIDYVKVNFRMTNRNLIRF